MTVRIEWKDLISWVGEQYPVILVIYDAESESAYWLHIQGEFGGGNVFQLRRRGRRVAVHVPLAQTVNEEAIRQFRKLKAAALARWQ